MRALTFALGAILTSYCSVGVLSEDLWQSNDQVNRDLCYFFLCNNAPLISHARNQITEGGKENVQQAIAVFRRALQQDAQDPYRWADLGDAFLDAGQKEDARYCYGQVLALAPRSAPFLLRVANFHFESGNNEKALRTTARILSLVSEYDSIVFGEYIRYVDALTTFCSLAFRRILAREVLAAILDAIRASVTKRNVPGTGSQNADMPMTRRQGNMRNS